MQDTMKHIHEAVEPAAGNPRFWGTITLRFRRGELTFVETSRTRKLPPPLPDDDWSDNT